MSDASIAGLANHRGWLDIEKIDKGWSEDRKYRITTANQCPLLCRVTPLTEYARKQAEFAALKQLAKQGLLSPEPQEIGITDDGESVYCVYSWLDGSDLDALLPGLAEDEQYRCGQAAGKALRLIHSLPPPDGAYPWRERYTKKSRRRIEAYLPYAKSFAECAPMLRFVYEHLDRLTERPQCFHHGDFHVGNLLYTPGGEIGVIDFNRFDYGDPWEEFNRIAFSWPCSRAFACGQIDGYFDGQRPPEAFFTLLALYIASSALASVPWAVSNHDEHFFRRMFADIRQTYQDFETTVPDWYGRAQVSAY